jgi:hypothetical protein
MNDDSTRLTSLGGHNKIKREKNYSRKGKWEEDGRRGWNMKMKKKMAKKMGNKKMYEKKKYKNINIIITIISDYICINM